MSDLMITRQPIYDHREHAAGYEVRFRQAVDGGDPLAQSIVSGSLEVLSGGLPVWVSVSEQQLLGGILTTPGNAAIIALLPAMLELTPDVLAAISHAENSGVVFAIDEFQAPTGANDPMQRLVDRARYARIDARDHEPRAFAALVSAARNARLMVVADGIDDKATYTLAKNSSAEYFVGSHFSRPEPLPAASLPTSTVAALRVLSMARDEKVMERDLERAISADPSVTFQLLRIVNSASIGGRGIESVGHALRLAGRNTLVRWLALATFASRADNGGVDAELTAQAVQRAYIAEGIAKYAEGRDPQTAFLIGLFSLIDAVFRIPMIEVVERINLAAEVREALLDRMGPYADILQFIESYELGLWESAAATATELGLPDDQMAVLYVNAVSEAGALLAVAV